MSPLHIVFFYFNTSSHNKSLVESPIPFVSIVYRPVGRTTSAKEKALELEGQWCIISEN